MKHLSAFFRPVTNALSAWSVGLHSFFSHLLISAGSLPQRNVSVTSASAAIVGTPSRRRRGLMLKPLSLMLLFLLGSLTVWGAEETATLQLSNSNKFGTSSGSTRTDDRSNTWTVTSNSGNINGNWSGTSANQYNGEQFGTGSAPWTGSFSANISGTITSVAITANTGGAATLAVKVGTTDLYAGTSKTATVAKKMYTANTIGTYTFTGSATGGITITVSSTNKAFYLNKIVVTYTTGSPSTPSVSLDPDDVLNFATVGVGDDAPAAKTFTITGSNMTAALSIADLTNFDYSVTSGSLSPSEGSISATVTVTPKSDFTTSAGNKSETLTISGDDLDDDIIELALNAEVKAKHNIIFDTDLKDIANVSVLEGETYNITETIEASLIASCTYAKFEGWTTVSSIADASTKPSLVGSVTMSTNNVTLKPVFSKTDGGSGSSEVTITPSDISGTGDPYTITHDQTAYTIQANKNNGSNAPAWNGDIRVYAKGTVVISNSSAMSRIVFNLSAQGLKRLAPISASAGTIATQASGDETVVWTGNETSVTFTVGDKADYGSDGSNKAGQLCFSTITATTGGGGTTTYSLNPGCAAADQCYAPTFSPAAGTFDVAQNVELACATDGADIYYTLNGGTPTSSSTKYTSAIPVTQNSIIKAIAIKDGMTDSEIAEGEFNIRYAQPTLTPSAEPIDGKYTSAITVTLAANGADAIYYAIGEVPTIDNEHLYSTPIELKTTGSKTINAIAVKGGYANSNVASATYVMDLPYANIAAFIDGGPTTAKSLTLNNAIITGVSGTTLYVQDETAGIMIYGLATLPENAAPNHSISGTIKGAYLLYKKQHELVNGDLASIDMSNVTISADEVARPTISEYATLNEAYSEKPMMLVKLTDVSYDGTEYEFAGNKIYNTFGALTGKTMPETTVNCDITGVVIDYNGTLELLPVFASDIVADADAADPTVSPAGGADAENVVTATAVEIIAAANTKVNGLDATTIDINSTTPAEVSVTVTRDFYRSVNYSCGWYKAAAAKYDINGQGATTEGEVVAKVAGVEAATAAEGDEVHVFITPNAHFHLATILVNGAAPTEVTAGEEYSFEMLDEAVTIAVTWTEDEKYVLTFTAGEGSGDAPAISGNEYYAGDVIPLPANTFTYDAQHKFTKWLIGGVEYAAGASYTMPAEATEVVAQWKTIPAFASGDWVLVKDAAELTEGSYVIIAAAESDKALSTTQNNNNRSAQAITKIADMLKYETAPAIFELKVGNKENTFAFYDEDNDGYIYAASSSSNYLRTETVLSDNSSWKISVTSTGVASATAQGTNTRNQLKNNGDLLSCFSSGQADIALYKYEEHKFTLTYNKNIEAEVSGMPEAQRANEENKVTVSEGVPTCGSKIFTGWNTQTDGEGETKAANTVLTLSNDLTLYAQWREPELVTISYDANEGSGSMDADADQVEGSTYTIKTNTFERNGYLFAGWKAYDAAENELDITNGEFTVPATDVTVKAQWQSATDSKWVLVEHLSQLAIGDKVIIAAKESDYALGAEAGSSNKYRAREAANKAGKLLIPTAGATQLTLGKSGDYYTFKDGDNYLMWSSGNTLPTEASVTDNSSWTISFEEGVMHIVNKKDENRQIQYNDNGGQERFATYTGAQKAVVLYKYLDINPEDATSGYEREDLVLSGIGTICLPYNVEASDRFGGVFYMPSHKTSGFANFIEETGTLKAGKAYIFVAENEFIRLKYSGDEVSEPLSDPEKTRGLIGTFTNIAPGNLTHKYVIANNKLMECGSGAYLNAYRAYLDLGAMPEEELTIDEPANAPARRRLGIGGGASGVTTDIEDVQGDSLSGIKVLLNGQLFIIRGEKMYDATGRLVK